MDVSDRATLIVIDVQEGWDDPKHPPRNNLDAEQNIRRLLNYWRALDRPVIHTQHCSTEPDSPLRPERPGWKIKEIALPTGDEPVLRKTVNSAFIGTNLEERLRIAGSDTVVVTGLTTDHCVSTTSRMAGNLGFTTLVVDDATATYDRVGHDGTLYLAEDVHKLSLATLHREFASIVRTEDLLQKDFAPGVGG